MPDPTVCLVTDRHRLAPGAETVDAVAVLESFLIESIGAGVDLIQVREGDLDAGMLCGLVGRLMEHASGTGVKIVVNDRADVALAAGADGVHLRADSPPAARVRPLSPDWLIGRSIHEGDEPSIEAADYVVFGNVFATASKPGVPARGLETLAALCASTSQPILAIGGVTPDNAAACRRAGAAGIAAIGAFLPPGTAAGALGVRAALQAFRAALG